MRQTIKIVLVGIIFLAGGIGIGFGLTYPSLEHEKENTDYWYNEYNDLFQNYTDLFQNYTDLSQDYADLLADYNTLVTDYADLFSDYSILQEAFEEPLTSYYVPTYAQIVSWLSVDNTDSFNYTGVWMCGDFSAMLMTRAKTMNWRVRIAVMRYSFEGEFYYGDYGEPYGSYGHAFCLIECSDGYIYYIEPQTDKIWWWTTIGYHFEIWTVYNFISISNTLWTGHRFWIHHYDYFA